MFTISSDVSSSSICEYLYPTIYVLYQKSLMSSVVYLAPSVDMVLFRCIFTAMRLEGYDEMLPL